GFDRIPNIFKEINEKQKEEVEKLLEKIENDDDVQNVFHTIKF
ncbi:MAG: YebC/PmpR family DNA-binding transcriptional regulator, partial [Flavobacteriaceae bacterium]